MTKVTIDNTTCYYRKSKKSALNGHVILCLHGSGGCGIAWGYQLSSLAKHYTIIIPDLPGHGKSGGEPLRSARDYAEWLDRFSHSLNLSSFFLFGHSFGGAIAQEYARAFPEKVHGIVLAATGTTFRLSRVYRTLHEQGLEPMGELLCEGTSQNSPLPEYFREGYELLKKTAGKTLHKDLLAAAEFDSTLWVSTLQIPTLVIRGSNDRITPHELSRDLADRIPDSRLHVIERAGHVVMADARKEFNRAVKEFIGNTSPC